MVSQALKRLHISHSHHAAPCRWYGLSGNKDVFVGLVSEVAADQMAFPIFEACVMQYEFQDSSGRYKHLLGASL